jgi:SAM-dependent methyltransferase
MSSKQYNDIHLEYSDCYQTSVYTQMEKENVRRAVRYEIQGARVLEHACGSGFYTFDLLRWGAASVVAIDISEEMIADARSHPDNNTFTGRVEFRVGDASNPAVIDGAPFDVVIAVWLLTYAPDHETLSRMFQTVAINLKPGGKFITTVIRPSSDPLTALKIGTVNFWSPHHYRIEARHAVPDGAAVRCILNQGSVSAQWDSFYLNRKTYESAARQGGMTGEIIYREPVVPEHISSKYPSEEMERLVRGETTLPFNLLTVCK